MSLPFLLIRLLIKSKKLPAYRHRLPERLGILKKRQLKPVDILIHAVSLGEVIAAKPLIQSLLKTQYKIMITTTTPTGSAEVLKNFSGQVQHVYLPFDCHWILSCWLKKISPRLMVIMETELWPSLLTVAAKQQVPIFLANARLSDNSVKRYQKIRWFLKPILAKLTRVLAQTQSTAERFQTLGITPQQLRVAGNLKFDIALSEKQIAQGKKWHNVFKDRLVFLAASTHNPEEEQVLKAFLEIQKTVPNALLLIAPRHPDRFEQVEQQIARHGVNYIKRTQEPTKLSAASQVMLIDTVGELIDFYLASHCAFIGGSLIAHGGHNPLEATLGEAGVISGHHIWNFELVYQLYNERQAVIWVEDENSLAEVVIKLFKDTSSLQILINNAKPILEENQGALKIYLAEIDNMLTITSAGG